MPFSRREYCLRVIRGLPDRGLSGAAEGFFHVFAGFGLSPVGVVTGIRGFLIFGDRPFALPANVEDLSAINIGPYLDPFRLEIAVQGLLEHPGRRLQITKFKEGLAHPE